LAELPGEAAALFDGDRRRIDLSIAGPLPALPGSGAAPFPVTTQIRSGRLARVSTLRTAIMLA
jgi:hypothetical protein